MTESLLRHSGLPHIALAPTSCALDHCSSEGVCHVRRACTGVRNVIETLVARDEWTAMTLLHDGCAGKVINCWRGLIHCTT